MHRQTNIKLTCGDRPELSPTLKELMAPQEMTFPDGSSVLEAHRAIQIDPAKLSGQPCFTNTRVSIKNLFDYLKAGETLDTFLEDFEGITREQALTVLEMSRVALHERLLEEWKKRNP